MRRITVALQVVVLVVLVGLAAFGEWHQAVQAKAPASWPVARVAEQVMPSVVGVLSYRGVPDGPTTPRGGGSGVVIRPNGYIVTNFHVVSGSSLLKVLLPDGKALPARLVGTDPLTDLAVVKVDANDLHAVRFVPEKDVKVGELAIAIGNPMGPGFARTVTVGVVSGLKRSLGTGYAQRAYDLIQTDAAINPGNSGGPLVDASGRVIGINSVKVATPGFESMGFAIPSDTVEAVANALIKTGRVIRPWLGVGLVGPETAMRLGLPLKKGLLVQDVYPGGPGQTAGLKQGDVIVAVDGRPMAKLTDLYAVLKSQKVGDDVLLTVHRQGATVSFKVKLTAMPEDAPSAGTAIP